MKNPLNKRIPREFKSEFSKYICLFLFLAAMIAIVSGFLVASNSIGIAYDESFEKYNIEDGNFELYAEAENDLLTQIEDQCDVSVYKNFYVEKDLKEQDGTIRIFENRTDVDKVCVMDGKLAESEGEIAIDRLYAENNNLEIGDTLKIDSKDYEIVGLVALSDYSALFQNTSDMMFDSIKFGVAVVTVDAFDKIAKDNVHYSYSWIYADKPNGDVEKKDKSEDFLEDLNTLVMENGNMMENYIPEYSNQAIIFTGDDVSGDSTMIAVFLYIVMIIIAFMFVITINHTIIKESNVIGTLKASGYTNGELIRHYMTAPVIILIAAAIIGNILGYTCLKYAFANTYYGSYSLPTYETVWDGSAFIKTTIIPIIILIGINLIFLMKKFKFSALNFLRRDLKKKKNKKAFKLNTKIGIMKRFRLRIIFQNLPNYLVIVFGVLFANFILLFGVCLTPLLNNYQDVIVNNMISDYQYILKSECDTENADAEKFAVSTLKVKNSYEEEVTIYGVEQESKYLTETLSTNDVYISDAYAKKYNVEVGDTVTLKAEFEDKDYSFKVTGIYYYPASVAVFMPKEQFNDVFDLETDYYNGYFSKTEITDINDMYIETQITEDDLTKTSRQLIKSFGSFEIIFLLFGLVMFALIIFILSKIIIEHNAQSISMVKILGYSGKEINGLYVLTTSIVVILSLIVTLLLSSILMKKVMAIAFMSYAGWLPYYVPFRCYLEIVLLGIITFAVVAVILMRKINKIPLTDALKNVE